MKHRALNYSLELFFYVSRPVSCFSSVEMAVYIQLDRPYAHFTNIDFITGRVILRLTVDESISSIVVKLEGESKTRLGIDYANSYGQYDRYERGRPEIEVHKVSSVCAWV